MLRVYGIPATHITMDGDEVNVTVILDTATETVGEYGERKEQRWTLEIATSSNAVVGDTFTVAGTVTEDDPYPDEVVWTAAQIINDDGYTRKFAVRQVTE